MACAVGGGRGFSIAGRLHGEPFYRARGTLRSQQEPSRMLVPGVEIGLGSLADVRIHGFPVRSALEE
jgi:hypothetical protein